MPAPEIDDVLQINSTLVIDVSIYLGQGGSRSLVCFIIIPHVRGIGHSRVGPCLTVESLALWYELFLVWIIVLIFRKLLPGFFELGLGPLKIFYLFHFFKC